MKVYQRTINYTKDGEKFRLIPYGDVHMGAENCDMEGYADMLKRHGKKPNTYFIDMGDGCDFILPKDSKRYRPSCVHPELRYLDDVIDQQIDWYCKPHENVADGRLLGVASGNHHDSVLMHHGTDPTQRIATRLGTENLGYCFFFRLLFKREGRGYEQLIIYGHHGWGGATRTEGGNLTKFSKGSSYIEADIHLFGHTHDKFCKRIIRVKPVLDKVKELPMIVANTGTFLRTLNKDAIPSYSEKAGYPPRDLGYVIIEITTPTADKPHFDLRGTV